MASEEESQVITLAQPEIIPGCRAVSKNTWEDLTEWERLNALRDASNAMGLARRAGFKDEGPISKADRESASKAGVQLVLLQTDIVAFYVGDFRIGEYDGNLLKVADGQQKCYGSLARALLAVLRWLPASAGH